MTPEQRKLPLWQRVDERFFWNRHLSQKFIEHQVMRFDFCLALKSARRCRQPNQPTNQPKLDEWILPVMDGFIHVQVCEVGGQLFDYILISRRSCFRTGTIYLHATAQLLSAFADLNHLSGARYQTRGADPLGKVANFVETEQLVIYGNIKSSFVQTRGSIPLIWHQKGKGIKPKPVIQNHLFAVGAFFSCASLTVRPEISSRPSVPPLRHI